MEEPAIKKIKLECKGIENYESLQHPHDENHSKSQGCNKNELLVGIKVFLNTDCRFSGVVKQRYSDFIVRECDVNGKPVFLTTLGHIDNIDTEDKSEDSSTQGVVPPIAEYEIQQINEFVKNDDMKAKLTLQIDNDKEHRKTVHKYIKDNYKRLETGTATLENNDRAILVTFKNSKGNKRGERRDKNKKQCHFVLFKQNKDTMSCINELARKIHVNPSSFTYAGTKDKRATTMQQVAVKHVLSKQLAGLNHNLRNVAVGNFFYSQEPLKLGDLSGNEFILVIRDVKGDDEVIAKACQSLKMQGFINYFGLQRFGTGAHPTHHIGKALLDDKIVTAVNMILTPRTIDDNNSPDFEFEAKQEWQETKDPEKAFRKLRSKASVEAKLLQSLCFNKTQQYETETCCKKAFLTLPRNMRSFYLHSYQSLLWNNAVSYRIENFGMKPIIGDIVLCNMKDDKGFDQVHTLTEEDIGNEKYTIYDVVLPLPGFDMIYPNNMKEFYKNFLKNDGLSFGNLKSKDKEFWLSGKYRKILMKPKTTSWNIVRYNDHTIPLFQNDLEKLQNATSETVDIIESVHTSGTYKGLVLSIMLPSSCYATCALREILTDEVSYQAQIELNEKANQ